MKKITCFRNCFLLICIILLNCDMVFAQRFKKLPKPQNIIIMIGDGMGFNHVKAADYYFGNQQQEYEKFPVKLAVAHYPAKAGEYEVGNPSSNYYSIGYNTVAAWTDTNYVKQCFTESAAAATALSTGCKTYNNAIGMSVNGDTLLNVLEVAKSIGKSAGVVTSVEFSHATPAGFVAHNVTRINYSQIARDMILKSRCNVIMGCGNPQYDDNGVLQTGKWKDAKYVADSSFWAQFVAGSGKRINFGVNGGSYTVSDCDGDKKPDPWTVIQDAEDFGKIMTGPTPKRVLGCPKIYSTLQQSRSMQNGENKDTPPFVTPFVSTVPSLSEMALGAINVLDNNKKGFFLMIEGGAIDWANHGNQKGRLIEEMKSFNDAVSSVIQWVNENSSWDETLLIVTADHETGYLWGDAPFTPLTYNGPNKLPGMKFNSNNHTNSLVPLYAKGAGSELYNVFADEQDMIRGPFIQNAEISQLIFFLWGKP